MYRIIAYHGRGNDEKVGNDLRLLWDGIRNFAKQRKIRHVYCFQAVRDGEEANLILIVQYTDNVAAKLALHNSVAAASYAARQSSQTHDHVDYWFYIRGSRNL